MLVGSRGHEPREPLRIEVIVLIFFGFWRALHMGNERMRIVVLVVIVESVQEGVEPALLGSGFFRCVDATVWHGREDKLVVDEVWGWSGTGRRRQR